MQFLNPKHETLRSLFDYCTSTFKDNKSFYYIGGEGYTYGEFGEKAHWLSKLLTKYGIGLGDKVAILSQNMPNWPVAFFSAVGFGRVAVPLLPDFSPADIEQILSHSESKALFVSDKLFNKIKETASKALSLIINLDNFSIIKGEEVPEKEYQKILPDNHKIDTEDLANIIYTSGTTGNSKGVMLSHKNLCANLYSTNELRPSYPWDVWLSLLPLPHTLEGSLCMILPMQAGASVYYMDKAPTPSVLVAALAAVRPTTILSVPLIIEKMYKSSVLPKFTKNSFMRSLYGFSPTRKLFHTLAGKELKKKFGGRMRFFGIGGAKLDSKVEKFLLEAKFPYAIGYGLTETAPLLAGANPSMVKLGSTGPHVLGVELKLIDQDPATGIGEITAKGDNVMMGYYKNPEATEAAFTPDGWFRTKDLGLFDSKGWLFIKGRTNNTIIGPSGENIYPEDIESVINSHYSVDESLVTEYKGRLTALVHFNQERLQNLIKSKDELKKEIMDFVNEKVSKFSRISAVDEHDQEFEKTPTKKIKRYLYNRNLQDKVSKK